MAGSVIGLYEVWGPQVLWNSCHEIFAHSSVTEHQIEASLVTSRGPRGGVCSVGPPGYMVYDGYVE